MQNLGNKIKNLLKNKIAKKLFVAILVSVFVASILAMLSDSKVRHKIKLYAGTAEEIKEQQFETKYLISSGYNITDETKFESISNEPQIVLNSINSYVDNITVYFNEKVSQEINVKIYYATEDRDICQEQMLSYKIDEGESKAKFYIDKKATNIHLNLGDNAGVSFDLKKIKINDGVKTGVIEAIINGYKECLKTNIFWDRLQIYFLICMFISLNIIIDIKKLYLFIFEKRWIIGCIFVLFMTVNQYTGDSITMYDSYVQTGKGNDYIETVVGQARAIRSDEWLVNDSISFSTRYLDNPYGKYNYIARGTNTVNGNRFTLQRALNPLSLCDIFIREVFGYGYAYAFSWWIILVLALLINIEFFMILTKKMKLLAASGACMVTFSSFFLWWQFPTMLIYGPGALVCFYLFFNREGIKNKLLYGYGTAYFTALYINMLYPAWIVPMGYLCLIVLIWMIRESWEKIKGAKKWEWLIVVGAVIVCIVMVGAALLNQMEYLKSITATEYPGSRVDYGGFSLNKLFNYIPAFLFAYKDAGNPCEASSLISLFPLPIIIAVISLIKEKKKSVFTIAMLVYSVFLIIYTTVGLPAIIAKITLMTYSTRDRAVDILGYTQLVLLIWSIYRLGDCEKIKKIPAIIVSSMFGLVTVYFANKYFPNYMGKMFLVVCTIVLIYVAFAILANVSVKVKNASCIVIIVFALITGVYIRPITKGTYAVDSKPLAKEIQSIVKTDKKSKWIAYGGGIVLSGFSVACGAPTINSVNTYPNMELWKKLDPSGQYNEVYNRYAHIDIDFTDSDTSMELLQADCMRIHLSYKDLVKTDVKYIVALVPLTSGNEYVDFEQLYSEDGSYIYKVIYK